MKPYILIIAVLVAFAGGWVSSSFVASKSIKTSPPQATPQAEPIANAPNASEPVDIYSGNGMTPAVLYDTLNSLSGVDFDKRYINYVLLMQADLSGINRLAKEKAVAPALKERATELWELDSRRLTDLYTLQKTLSYSHH